MKEKQFLKEIKDKRNGGEITHIIIRDLLEEFKTNTNQQSFFEKLLKKPIKTPEQIIKKNFELILDKTNDYCLDSLIFLLLNDDKTKGIIIDQFDQLLKRIDIAFNDGVIIKFKKLKNLSNETDVKFNEFLKTNKRKIVKNLLLDYVANAHEWGIPDKLIEEYTDTLVIMIEELLQSENKDFIDINEIGEGAYSKVFQIGEKVLKIGKPRGTYEIPNHPLILQPLTRIEFINKKPFACIEISDMVDRVHLNEKQLINIYKTLRDAGIIWTDIRSNNLGRLRKKNIPNLNGENFKVAPNSVGFTNLIDGEPLDIGDIVIIDTDFIYKEDSPNIRWGLAKRFEQLWQQEQQEKIAKKYRKQENVEERGIYEQEQEQKQK